MDNLATFIEKIYSDGAVGAHRSLQDDLEAIRRLVIAEQMEKARRARKEKRAA